jgi:hypothetical protein
MVVSTPLKNISQLGCLFPIYGKMKNAPNQQPDPRKDTSTYINSPSGNSAANMDSPFFQEEIPRGSSTPSCKPKVSKSRGYCQTHNIHPKESKSHTQVTVWCAALA